MNKWLYRAAGALGVASGTLLLSSGVAHAEATPSVDPEAMRAGVADFFTPTGPREEFIGGLLGGGGGSPLGGLTGGLGGLTGGKGGNNLLSGLTGGGDLLGSVTGTVTGGANPLGDLTGGLGGLTGGLGGGLGGLGDGESPLSGLTSGGPLSSLTGGLTDDGGPLKKVTGGLASGDGAVGAVTSRLTGKLFGGGEDRALGIDPALGLDPALGGMLAPDRLTAATLGPVSTDFIDPVLRGTNADTSDQQAIQLDPATARQVNDVTAPMVSALIADAVAKRMGTTADDLLSAPALPASDVARAVDVEPEESFPLVKDLPLVGSLLGADSPLGKIVAVGEIHRGIPLVGPMLDGNFGVDSVTKLPVVGSLVNNGLLKTSDGPGLPVVGSIPFVGGALNNLGKPAAPALPPALQPTLQAPGAKAPMQTLPGGQIPFAPPSSAIGTAPAAGGQAAPAANGPARVTQAPIHVGKHRATERPEVTDPDYLESGSLPLVGALTGGDLPLVGPLLKQLPLVGSLL